MDTITSRHAAPLRRLTALGAAAMLLASAACNDFLDPKPTDVLTPENFYKTASDAVAAVNAIYEQTKWSYWLGFWYISDIATDDIIASANFGSDGHRMGDYTFDPSEWPLGDLWGNAYKVINRANAVLDRVPAIAMDTALQSRLLGEAHFLRANAYFNLVRCFGDVPLIEHEVTSLQGLDVPRDPAADVYALIVSDLQAAAATLPVSYSGADVGRATRGAAQALLAKVYLTRQDWNNAALTAGAIIQSGQYSLLPNWKDNFRIADEIQNSESIFEINYDGTLDPGAGSVHTLFSIPANFPGGDAYGLMYIPPSLQAIFDSADTRGEHGTFMISGRTVDALGDTVTWAMPPGPAFAKYLDETNTQNMNTRAWASQDNDWIVLRYADVLLMYAEAVNEGGPEGPITKEAALNAVRTRAHIAPVGALSQEAFRDSVRLERRREFVFEGQRWFDLSRWGLLDAAIRAKTAELQTLAPGETTVHGVPSNLMPIPQSEIDINPKLTQNPGW
ncbi:MAG: RagB/SusD family nutrient uptake outer membrane protein [Gemmatimonadaceae bacterium]|nr:RagB/SusD family nutrient uptake outer membrane protein [Gemmatimonadaceae bacterium]